MEPARPWESRRFQTFQTFQTSFAHPCVHERVQAYAHRPAHPRAHAWLQKQVWKVWKVWKAQQRRGLQGSRPLPHLGEVWNMSGASAPMTKAALRARMPFVTAVIDDLRAVFGVEAIENQIRKGLHPDCPADETFFASEGGLVLGKRAVYPAGAVFITPTVI